MSDVKFNFYVPNQQAFIKYCEKTHYLYNYGFPMVIGDGEKMAMTLVHSSRHAPDSTKQDPTSVPVHMAVCRVVIGEDREGKLHCNAVLPLSEILREHHVEAHPELDGMSMALAAKGLSVLKR